MHVLKNLLPEDLSKLVLGYLTLCQVSSQHVQPSSQNECFYCHEIFCDWACDRWHLVGHDREMFCKRQAEKKQPPFASSKSACYLCAEPFVCRQFVVQCSCGQCFHQECLADNQGEKYLVRCNSCQISVCHGCTAPSDLLSHMSWSEWCRCSGLDWSHTQCGLCSTWIDACSFVCRSEFEFGKLHCCLKCTLTTMTTTPTTSPASSTSASSTASASSSSGV